MNESTRPLRLLFVAGAGRSGSTLLARLLGEIPGYLHLGEALRGLYNHRMLARIPHCGCGSELGDCPFWGSLMGEIDPGVRDRATEAVKLRAFPRLVRAMRRGAPPRMFAELARDQISLLRRVAERSGARVLVDASKHPTNALLLCGRPELEVRVVHLVRDPRAVVASWGSGKGYLRPHHPLRSTFWWRYQNLAAERLRELAAGYHRLRYEDLVADPPGELLRALAGVGAESVQLPFLEGRVATIGPQHTVAGNPDRSRVGAIEIRRRPWRLGWAASALTSLAGIPLTSRYGYPLWRRTS